MTRPEVRVEELISPKRKNQKKGEASFGEEGPKLASTFPRQSLGRNRIEEEKRKRGEFCEKATAF